MCQYTTFPAILNKFDIFKQTISASASNAVTKFFNETVTCLPQIITFAVVKKEGAQERTTISWGRTIMQALCSCCGCLKGISLDE